MVTEPSTRPEGVPVTAGMRNEHLFLFKAHDGQNTFCWLYADTGRGRDVIVGRHPQRFPHDAVPSATRAQP
ncbi:hypothetical protein GCM10010303_79540 [Streptomyces purpurascens]|nr:hypothetical protein GCM10010303_79540 [Streptomyces purpurascens]